MADQANFFVKNLFTEGSVEVTRKLPNGTNDSTPATIPSGVEGEMVPLQDLNVFLEIKAPPSVDDIKDYCCKVSADVDIKVICSRTDSKWLLNIEPNSLDPIVPTTVNVTVGENETGN